MKILIANYEFPPVGGGASKVSFELARTLVKMGHEVVVLTSRSGDALSVELVERIVVHRVCSWRIGVHDAGLRGAITYLLSALPRLRKILKTERIDVVHYFFGLPTGLLSLYSHSVKKLPYIVSLRGSDVPLYDRDSKKLRFLHWLTKRLSRKIWRDASQVFAVSGALARLANESFPDIPVGVIYNGVDIVEAAGRKQGSSAADPIRLICVSRLIPRKGVHNLLDAFANLARGNIILTIIGEGPSESALKAHAEAIGIADDVTFEGSCTAEEVQAHYLQSDIFVLPTRSDAFANVILEAMSAGLPVIASDVGGVAEAVADGNTGILVQPGRPKQLTAAIQKLATDDDLRVDMGNAGRERVRKMFAWGENARLHIEAYAKAIQKR